MAINSGLELRLSAGNPERFAGFYDRHFKDLLAYLTRRVGDVEAGLDLTAETFAQAYLSRRRFRGSTEQEAAAWLFTIGKRQLARYLKNGQARKRAMERLRLERPELDRDQVDAISELAGLAGLRTELAGGLEALSTGHREAVSLRVLDDLPFSEVARRLGISEVAARKRVSRALSALAQGFG